MKLCPSLLSSISIAENVSLAIQGLLESDWLAIWSLIDFEVQGDVFTAVIKWNDGATDLVKTLVQVLELPLGEDPVEVAVVKIKEWI